MDVRRALDRKPSLPDVLGWLDMRVHDGWSGFWGTVWFRCKAAALGVECGDRVRVWGRVIVRRCPKSRIIVGDGVDLISDSKRARFTSIKAPCWFRTETYDAVIEIGDRVGMSGVAILCRSTKVTVGEGAMVAANVTITDTDAHAMWPPETRRSEPALDQDRPVVIGRNVWLGAGCTVLKGVTIGDNSVVGATSLVTGDIPPNVLAAGVPARVIRQLP